MRSIKTYLEILRKKGLYMCLREAKKAFCPLWWTRSRYLIDNIRQERVSRLMFRRYGKLIAQPVSYAAGEPVKIIWLCWLQGEEQAPEVVKRCVQSVRRYAEGYELRLITANNLFDYAHMPDYIVDKYKSGKITFTHFSDIFRTCLLYEYGGVWIDATVLLTGPLPQEVLTCGGDSGLFVYQNSWLQMGATVCSSWLIAAIPEHPVMRVLRDCLFAYWKERNVLRDYYLFHIFFALVVRHNPVCKDIFSRMPYVPNADAHTLQFKLFESYNAASWQVMTKRSSVHKLTWKFADNSLLDNKGTYYDYILHRLHI